METEGIIINIYATNSYKLPVTILILNASMSCIQDFDKYKLA